MKMIGDDFFSQDEEEAERQRQRNRERAAEAIQIAASIRANREAKAQSTPAAPMPTMAPVAAPAPAPASSSAATPPAPNAWMGGGGFATIPEEPKQRDLLAPVPALNRDPSGPAKVQSNADAVYGSSPAAQLFRKKTAQIAPSAPMATGFERNPVAFNNTLNRPDRKPRDLLAPLNQGPKKSAEQNASAGRSAAPPGTAFPGGWVSMAPEDELARKIAHEEEALATMPPNFFSGSKFGRGYDNNIEQRFRALDSMKGRLREMRQQQQAQQRADAERNKPLEVDGALRYTNPDGTVRWERPPAREKEAKAPEPPKVVDRYDDREGNRILVWQDHTGKKWEEKAQFQGPKPRDPDAEYNRRETDRDERDRKREEDREKREEKNRTAAAQKQAERDARMAWLDVDQDETIQSHAAREAKKRRIATYFGVAYPPTQEGQNAPSASPGRSAAPAPVSSHAPAAPAGNGADFYFVRDPKTNQLVGRRGR